MDSKLRIDEINECAADYFVSSGNPLGKSLSDVLPESVGLNDILNDLLKNKKSDFQIPKIVREKEDGSILFFDFSVFKTDDKTTALFCLFEDVTESALNKQTIQQQKNELLLLQQRIASQDGFQGNLLGDSTPMEELRQILKKVASVPTATVLLQGETGSGKSMAARTIHDIASSKKPFVEVSCAAIPATLLEAELFGHEKGAFTHAVSKKTGLFEEANGGTLFLDEIGEMDLGLQAKLLAVLETRRFRRVGSTRELQLDARFIAATNQDLETLVRNNQFREDLFYRLNVIRIDIPALREMERDVMLLAHHFVNHFNIAFHRKVKGFSADAELKLLGYQWPGNIRELRNCIERAMIFIEADRIQADDLIIGSPTSGESHSDTIQKADIPTEGLSLEAMEKNLIQQALSKAGGNKSKAARLLHLSRDTFRYRLEKHGLL